MASSLSFIKKNPAPGHFVSTFKSFLEITVRFRADTAGMCVDLGSVLSHKETEKYRWAETDSMFSPTR